MFILNAEGECESIELGTFKTLKQAKNKVARMEKYWENHQDDDMDDEKIADRFEKYAWPEGYIPMITNKKTGKKLVKEDRWIAFDGSSTADGMLLEERCLIVRRG